MTPEERDVFQNIVDEYHQNFQDVVYENRKEYLSREDLKKIADGRVMTASQALDAKLIDEIGYFDKALQMALDLASLPEANVVSYTYFPSRKISAGRTTGLPRSTIAPDFGGLGSASPPRTLRLR